MHHRLIPPAVGVLFAIVLAFPAPAQEKLSRMLTRHLEQVTGYLDKAEKAVAQKNTRRARSCLEEAETQWKTFHEWNKGKFDPAHPDVVAVGKRVEAVRGQVAALTGKAAGMARTLPAVLDVITDNEKKLNQAMRDGRIALMGFQSEARSYRRIQQARAKLARVPSAVARVNDRLPVAWAAARDFRRQFPDLRELEKLVRNGRRAGQAAQRLERVPAAWLEMLSRTVRESLDTAESNIASAEKELKDGAGLDASRKANIAENAYQWAVDHADLMLQIVPAAFPELPDEARALFPEFVKARDAFTGRARALEVRSRAIAGEVGKIRKQAVDARKQRIAAARFPGSNYRGGEWAEAEAAIGKAWARKIRDKQLHRVAIASPWDERTEARWRGNRWILGTYRYLGAHCLAKLASGKCMVYRMSFRRTKQPDGRFGPLELWSVGHAYEIAADNIDK